MNLFILLFHLAIIQLTFTFIYICRCIKNDWLYGSNKFGEWCRGRRNSKDMYRASRSSKNQFSNSVIIWAIDLNWSSGIKIDLFKRFICSKDIPYSLRYAVEFLRNTYVKEGLIALWRGNSATMARIIPYAAIQFTSHEQWRKVLRVDRDGSTSGRRFLAGSLAGITSQTFTYPLDLARARMAVTDKYTGYKYVLEIVTESPSLISLLFFIDSMQIAATCFR